MTAKPNVDANAVEPKGRLIPATGIGTNISGAMPTPVCGGGHALIDKDTARAPWLAAPAATTFFPIDGERGCHSASNHATRASVQPGGRLIVATGASLWLERLIDGSPIGRLKPSVAPARLWGLGAAFHSPRSRVGLLSSALRALPSHAPQAGKATPSICGTEETTLRPLALYRRNSISSLGWW